MLATVQVVPRAQYDAFVDEARFSRRASSTLGHEMWQGACMKCHRLNSRYIGPALQRELAARQPRRHRATAAQRAGTDAESRRRLDDAEIDALIAYTKQFAKGGS